MNPYEDTVKSVGEMMTAVMAVYAIFTLAAFANFIATSITAINCAIKGPRNKTPWVIVILAVPLLGWISYWIWAEKEESPPMFPQRSTTPAPARPASKDVADAVTADIEEMVRKRRAER